jgi:hypothetical protein
MKRAAHEPGKSVSSPTPTYVRRGQGPHGEEIFAEDAQIERAFEVLQKE